MRFQTRALVGVLYFCLIFVSAHVTKKSNMQLDGFDCDACRALVDLLGEFVKHGKDEQFAEEVLLEYCKIQSKYSTEVCSGIIKEFIPEATYILLHHPNPEQVCWQVSVCTNVSEVDRVPEGVLDFRSSRPHPMRPYISASTPKENRQALANARAGNDPNTGLMVHLADIHLDLLYIVGSQSICDDPLCCRNGEGSGDDAAGVWGAFPCDTTALMLDSVLQEIAMQFPTLDYIVWTGDASPHDVWNQSQAYNNAASAYVSERVAKFLPGVHVLWCVGNHEAFPIDQDNDNPNMTQALAAAWAQWLPDDQRDTFINGGYFSYVLTPGLRFVSIDGSYALFDNFWTLLSASNASYLDIGNQLQWLNDTLAAAAEANEVIWLIAHTPFGESGDLNDRYSLIFYNILAQYPGLVKGAFFGHTHYDSFRVYSDAQGTPFLTQFIAPSITPYTGDIGHHPTFRVYAYDKTSFEVIDWVQYYTNLTEANANPTSLPVWQMSYQMLERYNLPALDPASMQAFAQQLWNNTALWQDFCNNYYVLRTVPGRCSDSSFVRVLACSLETKTSLEYNVCILTHALP